MMAMGLRNSYTRGCLWIYEFLKFRGFVFCLVDPLTVNIFGASQLIPQHIALYIAKEKKIHCRINCSRYYE